jgi:hypothetical protein
VKGRVLSAGQAEGRALVLDEPLSLWGGMDPQSGEVIDARHPQHGAMLTGHVLVMPGVRGSSSSSSVLAEAVRAQAAPAAILLAVPDLIVAVGSAVAGELYGMRVPVIVLSPDELATIVDGAPLRVDEDGTVT